MRKFDKAEFEREVFLEFVRISGMPIDIATIEQRRPPFPDIVCVEAGVQLAYELTLITDQTIERKVRRGKSGYSNFKIEIEDVVSIIRKKRTKPYSCKLDIDLIIHEGATPVDDLWLYETKAVDEAIQTEVDIGRFRRVWLLDMSNEYVRTYTNTEQKGTHRTPLLLAGEGE